MSAVDSVCVIGLLGPVAVGVMGTDAVPRVEGLREVAGVRARRLLASLVMADGRTRSADRLIDDVWGDDPPRSPQPALHTQVSRLRQLLGPGRLEAVGNGYRLVGCETDFAVVARLMDQGDGAALDEARHWWRGEPGADLGADDLAHEVRTRAGRLAELRDRRRVAVALTEHDFSTARAVAEKLSAADPFDESAQLDLMRALDGEGRTSDALAVFARLRRTLSEQLGTDPGPQITAYHTALLAGPDQPPRQPHRSGHRVVGLLSETTTLIGREADVHTIAEMLDHHRLVTVQGPGGVGKTRVANRIGHHAADAGRSVFYVPLAPIRDDNDVVPAIATVLGVGETDLSSSGRPRLAVADLSRRLVDALRGEDALLILDNCEQVIDRCAAIVDEILSTASKLTILVTSRAPLLLPAEQIYLLPVLDVADAGPAVELFETRARAVRPDARLPRPAIVELCRHLDGLPLAIELAAARMRTMTVEEISRRLAERFALLRGQGRTVPDRHRTLHAVIEWSWQLLDPDGQDALRRLCRFPAGFTAQAAAVMLGINGFGVDDTLESLVNQSLLRVVDEGGHVRYRMLEMVREFGEEKLAAAESVAGERDSDMVRRLMWRWAREFSGVVGDRYDDGIDETLLAVVTNDVENLVWILRDAVTVLEASSPAGRSDAPRRPAEAISTVVTVYTVLVGYWMVRGLQVEMLDWGARLITALPTPPQHLDEAEGRNWRIAVTASMARQVIDRDARLLARGRFYLRRLHHPEDTYDDPTEFLAACALSRDAHEAMRTIVRGVNAGGRVGMAALGIRMNIRENVGTLDGAQHDAMRLRDDARAHNDLWISAMTEVTLGSILGQQTQWRSAAHHFEAGIVDLERIGAREDSAQARCYLVAVLVSQGDFESAAANLAELSGEWRPGDPVPTGNPEVVGATLLGHAEYQMARGETDIAAELYWQAGDLLKNHHPMGAQDPGMVMLVSVTVVGLMRVGRVDRARSFLDLVQAGVIAMMSEAGWFDRPQAGTMALAAGYALSAEEATRRRGAQLMILSRKLVARRDYPSLFVADRDMAELSGLTSDEWSELYDATMATPRTRAMTMVADLFAEGQ